MIPECFKRKKHLLIEEINVTPMVDVMLVLLIVFMITSPMLVSQINVRLPEADSSLQTESKDDPIEISVTKDRKVYILNTLVPLAQLQKKLIAISHANFEAKILVSGDSNANYGDIIAVIDKIKLAGFSKIGLITGTSQKMFLGFNVRFTWISLILHLACIIALAFIKFEGRATLNDAPKDISISFDVISNIRNIKTRAKKPNTAAIPKAAPKVLEQKKKAIVSKEVTKSIIPAKKEIKSNTNGAKTLITKATKSPTVVTKQPAEKYEDLFGLGEMSDDNSPESIKAVEYIKGKIEEHRNFVGLCGKGLDEVEMFFEISLNTDGSISFAEYLCDNAGKSITENTRQALICQNLRAIQLAAPFDKLVLANYKNWQHLRLRFTQN
jgi:biopolymer transport protein TolR